MLEQIDTGAPAHLDKRSVKEDMKLLQERLYELQQLLYASAAHGVLLILQGMDASGKDGAIRKVFSGIDPQGLRVTSFKAPTDIERKHDFLWRVHAQVPQRGMIGAFNRSHYEEVLITRVHGMIDEKQAERRFRAINDFERLLAEEGTVILKFYLHTSPEEQQARLQERIDNPKKRWKHDARDWQEAKRWEAYMQAYEDVFVNCSEVPWLIVPADQNWYKEYVILEALVDRLEALGMKNPPLTDGTA